MIRRLLFLCTFALFLGPTSAGSCQDFSIGKFGPDTIDNKNFCSGACIAAGDSKGEFTDSGNGGYKCDCLDNEGTITRTLCDETTSSDRGSVAASTEESGAVSKNISAALLFVIAGYKFFF